MNARVDDHFSLKILTFNDNIAKFLKNNEIRVSIYLNMKNTAKYYWIVFGILAAMGGYIGYQKAGSTISLVAGGICGLILMGSGGLVTVKPHLAAGLATFVSLVMLSRFIPLYIEKGKAMPAIPVIVLSIVSLVIAFLIWKKKDSSA